MQRMEHQTFRATLRPHRSLGRKGFIILMAVLICLNFAAGTAFYLLGAWPIREELRFTRDWVKVELEEDKERDLIGGLFLRFRGERTEIGRFLGAREREKFAILLRRALSKPHI
jgi:uncharacterized membrane protein